MKTMYEGRFGKFEFDPETMSVELDEDMILEGTEYTSMMASERDREEYIESKWVDAQKDPSKFDNYIRDFDFGVTKVGDDYIPNKAPEGYVPQTLMGYVTKGTAVYTFEHKASPDDKIGYSVAVGKLDEYALDFGEFENQEVIDGKDWVTCKWHKDIDAVEDYIKSNSGDYDKMLEEKRILFNSSIDSSVATSKGWTSVVMNDGPQNIRYMNFSNGFANFDNPGDYITKQVAMDGGKFVKNTNLMIDAHDFAGHPDGDILHVTSLEDKVIQYRDAKGDYHDIKVDKGDEMYVGGETVLDRPVPDFKAILQEKIKETAENAKDRETDQPEDQKG